MIADLERARAALDKGRTDEALDDLLTAWRAKRAPEIADAIDALAHAFPKPSLDQSTWMTLAREGRPGDVYGLLATLVDTGPVSALGGRIEKLIERPDDPRIAVAFANLALDPPTTSSSNFPVWTKIFGAIEKMSDPRVIPILRKRARMKPGASNFWPKLANWIAKALKKVAAAPKLTKEEAAAVTAVARAAKKAKPVKATAAAKPKKASAGDALARAIAAVKENDLPACVDALLDGWRERPFAQYAAAIDRVTALHDEGLACPSGKEAELHKAWLALAAKKRAIDVGRLAESAGDGKASDVDQRFEAMLGWPSDPRIGRAMFLHCITRAFGDRARTWGLVADLLVKNVDVRFAAELESFAETRGENKARRAAMRRAGPAALKAIATVPKEPTNNELVAFDQLNAALDEWDAKRPITERRMLEAIANAPDDHGPALVYADWLTERGHPRGELIVLQCSEKPDAERLRELISQNARALLGPAAPLVYSVLSHGLGPGSFRRGLVRTLELRNDPPPWMFANHPQLWFLESIEPDIASDETAAAVILGSRSLRALEATPRLAARLASQKTPLTVESLRLSHGLETQRPLSTLLDGIGGQGLSRVKHLELFWGNGNEYQDGIPDALVASPLFGKLETLAVAATNLSGVIETLKKHQRAVSTLSFLRRYYLDYRLDVRLDKKLAPTAVSLQLVRTDLDGRTVDAEHVAPLVAALESLKLPAKTKLSIGKGIKLAAPAKRALSKVVALA